MKKSIFIITGLFLLTGCTTLPEAEHPPVVSSKYTKDYQKKKEQSLNKHQKPTKSNESSSNSEEISNESSDKTTRFPEERNSLVSVGGLTKELVDTISDEAIQQSLSKADALVQNGQLDRMTAFINDITTTLDQTESSLDQTIEDLDKETEDENETDEYQDDKKTSSSDKEGEQKQDSLPTLTPDQAIMSVVGIYGDSPEGAKYVQTGAGTDETGQPYHTVQLIPEGLDATSATMTYRVYDNGTVSTN